MSIYRGAGGASDATDDSTVNAVAGYASAAASSASSAATSATNASNSATAAASSASSAASSASSVATNASNAASSAGLANTYATAANNSKEDAAASAATASTKAGEASTSASNAAASASTASTQATNAASSASAAATSASAASTSASNAASSAASALAIYGNTTAMNTAVAAAATSATNADTSADAAYDAQILAEAAVTGASSYASAAQVSANDSQAYAGASEAFKDSALAAASAANISATSAASSAASAATSATNAAASATSAAAITGSGNGTFVNTPITTNSTITLSGGRANGVAYLNGSKVLTTGSSLTFDGSNLSAFGSFTSGTTGVAGSYVLARSSDGAGTTVLESLAGTNNIGLRNTAGSLLFSANNAEGMRLTSTGLGIGTTSPSAKLHVFKSNQNQLQLQCDDTGQVNINMGGTTTPAKGSINFSDNANAMWFNTASTERMRLDSSGNLLVGTTNATPSIGVVLLKDAIRGIVRAATTVTTADALAEFYNPNGKVGQIVTNGTATSYATSSDYRLKENVQPMTGALAKVAQLKPVTYTWKTDGSAGEGFIAHEMAEVCPQAVTGEKDAVEIQQYEISPAVPATYDEEGNELTPAVEAVMGEREVPKYQGIDVSFLVGTLTAAIQEQQAMIQELTARVTQLESK